MAVGHFLGSLELLAAGAAAVAIVLGSALFVGVGAITTAWLRSRHADERARPPRIQVTRRLPVAVRAGEAFHVTLVAEGGARRSALALLDERVGKRKHIRLGIAALPMGTRASISYEAVVSERGVQSIGPGVLRRGDWFGIAERIIGVVEASTVTVLPAPIDVPAWQNASVSDLTRSGPSRTHRDVSDDRGDLRAYVSGDDLRRVHWRTSARLGMLVVAPPAPPADSAVPRLLVDLRRSVHSPASIEVALRAATEMLLRNRSAPWSVELIDHHGTSELRTVDAALQGLACYSEDPGHTPARQTSRRDANPVTIVITGSATRAGSELAALRGAHPSATMFRCSDTRVDTGNWVAG